MSDRCKAFYGPRISWPLEVTQGNKPHTSDLLGRNPDWLLSLNEKRDSSRLGGGTGFYRDFEACTVSQWKSIEEPEVLLCW